MKKLLVITIAISLVSIAAISTKQIQRSLTERKPVFILLDSTKILDQAAIRKFKTTPAAMAEAARLYRIAMDTVDKGENYQASFPYFIQALRTCPIAYIYERYANTLMYTDEQSDVDPLKTAMMLSDTLKGAIPTAQYIAAAKYAFAHKDTASTITLLGWCMSDVDEAYKAVDKEEAFRALENYPDYYYMMDNYLREDAGQQSTLRTMRYTKAAEFPYALTLQTLYRTFDYIADTSTDPPKYTSPYSFQDDAMRDLVRGNRFGRFSRETDHGVQYVATLHLSKDFFTYIYSTQQNVNRGRMFEEDVLENDSTPPPAPKAKKENPNTGNAAYDEQNTFYLINIDKYGKMIAEQQIGCTCSPLHISMASVDKAGYIEVKEIEQKWKKDPLEAGYKDNEVASRNVTGIKHYKIKGDGTIIAVSESATAKAQ